MRLQVADCGSLARLPSSLANLTNVTRLGVNYCEVLGSGGAEGIECICGMTNLRELSFIGCGLPEVCEGGARSQNCRKPLCGYIGCGLPVVCERARSHDRKRWTLLLSKTPLRRINSANAAWLTIPDASSSPARCTGSSG